MDKVLILVVNIYLQYFKKHELTIDETPYTINVNYGGQIENYEGRIKKEDRTIHVCTFTLGIENNIQDSPNAPINGRRNTLLQERNRLQQELDRINRELKEIENT